MNEVVPTTEAAGTEESKQSTTAGTADEVDEKKRLANQKKK